MVGELLLKGQTISLFQKECDVLLFSALDSQSLQVCVKGSDLCLLYWCTFYKILKVNVKSE